MAAPTTTDDLAIRLTDCLAPFWAAVSPPPGTSVNWSKIPFAAIEARGFGNPVWEETLFAAVDRYLDAVGALGYTAIAVDDLAHLVIHPWYPAALRQRLIWWGTVYREVFARARARGLAIFVTSDYAFFNPTIDAHLAETRKSPEAFFVETVAAALATWPELDGLVLRIGECDGIDVDSTFPSRLTVRQPEAAHRLLRRLLPLFEGRGQTLIVRTWTLGAYPIGDLIWNPKTWDRVFAGIDSPSLVVSLKYGDADFFRFLPLNPLFFHGPQRKMIEFQCRREYEGMGEFPAFVGWQYEHYWHELRAGDANLAGVFAIQGGGWAPFHKLPFAEPGSIWNELNVETVASLSRGKSVEESVRAFCAERGIADADGMLDLLRLADVAVGNGIYVREFAERAGYFRRVRIPPLLWVFWHHVSSGGLVSLLHRMVVRDPGRAVAEGLLAVNAVERMVDLARRLGLDDAPFQFQLETFRLLALHRQVLLRVATDETHREIAALLPEYQRRYPGGYAFGNAELPRASVPERPARWLMRALIRPHGHYRWPDHLHLSAPVSRLMRRISRHFAGALPRFVGQQGMSPESLLR